MPDSGILELPRQTRGTGGSAVGVQYRPAANSGANFVESLEAPLARWFDSSEVIEFYRRVLATATPGNIQVALDAFDAIRNSLVTHAELALDGFENFAAYGWDGEDAEPIRGEDLQYARRLLKSIGAYSGIPDAAPGADGSICMEWISSGSEGKRKIVIDVGPGDKVLTYARFGSHKPIERHFKKLDPTLIDHVKGLFARLRVK